MSYSIIGIIAIMVHLIINRDMLWHYSDYTDVPSYKEYREYILGMLFFCVADVLWGFLNDLRLVVPLYVVTVLYFITMMAGFCCGRDMSPPIWRATVTACSGASSL